VSISLLFKHGRSLFAHRETSAEKRGVLSGGGRTVSYLLHAICEGTSTGNFVEKLTHTSNRHLCLP
jgi:hypothetical protein